MHDYHDLLVWRRSMEFVKLVYRLTKLFPKEEMYGLTSQFRRASVSVVANIVEGKGKSTQKDFCRFLYISQGSLNECECYLEISKEIEFITTAQFAFMNNKRRELGFLLHQFIQSVERKSSKRGKGDSGFKRRDS
jgi:four helix bundle protein